jgi:hypothetical protein
MALLAEVIVEEWLNRQGYFTIRGIRLGVQEIDLLASKLNAAGTIEGRHIEVQASMRPVGYISRVPKQFQKLGRSATSAKRMDGELAEGVKEWVQAKFHKQEKVDLMKRLWNGAWSCELVLNVVKSQQEVALIRGHDVRVLWLKDIVDELAGRSFPVSSAAGADFIELINIGSGVKAVVTASVPGGTSSA